MKHAIDDKHSRFHGKARWSWLLLIPLILAACSPTGADGGAGGNGANNGGGVNNGGANNGGAPAKVFDPSAPLTTFQSTADPGERERIVQEMWPALTAPSCWDASFVGPATPSGTAAAVMQYTFSGQFQYRYYGFDIYSGTIRLVDLGRYKGYPAALISTWSGDTEGLILVDKSRFEHVLTNPSGVLYSLTYWTSNGPCL